ncbi:pyrophosphate--fructose 6-phosphate 1-phosphotransferase [Dictyobacter vulcani]|uniref:Pyrophosphate--fructose 6-phosphate 1-phosphotransferase n=1 Tax=Dictyobacter vulcani TaxID=2607529 RepID=A0A5J4KJ52_9CHLR|nr:6-phosphofructokinase [Dictyobacter vulcani]GER86191.1 pyrophosphate--fructose 6-phosphate 1-phosphotransferase [Dictyobacter vulcani]
MSSKQPGNLIIGQSGGATAVINASLVGAVEAALTDQRIGGIYGMHHGIEGLLKEDIIDLSNQPNSVWSQLLHTPSAALGSCRYKLQEHDLERTIEILRRYDIRYMLYIGGNDSADTAHQLAQAAQQANYELFIISIPKTIDNDLPFTDHCPGYGSAARFLAQATQDSTMNTLSIPWHYPVKVIETMGRDAGWLTASAALGKRHEDDAPHILLLPEQPFQEEYFLTQVEAIYKRIGYVIVVAAEAIRDTRGQALGTAGQAGMDAFHHPLLSGAAQYLVELVKRELKIRARFDKPGDLQRMSSAHISSPDRDEAYLAGKMGVQALLAGESDKMITLVRENQAGYHCTTGLADLGQVANVQRLMPDEYLNADKTMVTQAFYEYALPLIGEPLVHHTQLEMTRIRQ